MPDHPIIHIEIPVTDPETGGQFYTAAFGWQARHHPRFNYTSLKSGTVGCGLTAKDSPFDLGGVLVYIQTSDIEATLTRIEAAGGQIVIPRTDIPGLGSIAIFSDPTGNHLGLYTPTNNPSQETQS